MPVTGPANSTTGDISNEDGHAAMDSTTRIIVGVLAVLIGLLIAIGCVLIYILIKRRKEGQSGKMEAQSRVKAASSEFERQACHQRVHGMAVMLSAPSHPSACKASNFAAMVKSVDGMKRNEKTSYISKIRCNRTNKTNLSEEVRRVLDQEFVQAKHCRRPGTEVLEYTQAPVVGHHVREKDHWSLNANLITELYGFEFVISDAPTEYLFEYHWEVIWQRKIGLIVWLGPLRGLCCGRYMDPYIGLSENEETVHGRFDVRTTKALKFRSSYDLYTVVIQNRHVFLTVDTKGQESRELYLMHITSWPSSRRSANPKKMATMVELTRALQLERAGQGLGGILAQCSSGTSQTATFYTLFFNRQMHYRFHYVNIQAIMQILANVRYQCFQLNTFDHVRLIHRVMLEFVKEYPVMRDPDKAEEIGELYRTLSKLQSSRSSKDSESKRQPQSVKS